MRYTVHLATAGDEKHTAYSYVISNFEGVKASGVFIATGDRRHDESYCGHIALQRALRQAAKMDGVIAVNINFDASIFNPLAFEVVGVNEPLYPSLARTTSRILQRFAKYDVQAGEFGADDADRFAVAALDNALDELEQTRTIKGRLQLFIYRFTNPQKLIR